MAGKILPGVIISLDFLFCISDIMYFTAGPVQSSMNMLCMFPDGRKSLKVFVDGIVSSLSLEGKDTKYLFNSFAITGRSI